jgi:hypothetical protein
MSKPKLTVWKFGKKVGGKIQTSNIHKIEKDAFVDKVMMKSEISFLEISVLKIRKYFR